MKRLIFVIAIFLCLELVLSKTSDKIKVHRKKTTSIKKKSSSQKSVSKSLANLDLFKSLPVDDLQFIKDLDKQFKLHGDKIKIKIERESSNTTKNSKRTIDGELGYGYQNAQNHYQFSPPKYVYYPYSQRDIPPLPIHQRGNHHGGRTQVSIEPSHAFELKEVHNYPHNQQLFMPAYQHPQDDGNYMQYQQHQQISEHPQAIAVEPVIVLRIPGPTKYAAHLQALLQQYLELRAAHYIKLLQETEAQHYHQQHEPIIHQQPEYRTQPEYQRQYEVPENHEQHEHHQNQQEYQPVEQVYEQVNQNQQAEQAQSHQPQNEPERFHIHYEHQQPQTEEQPPPQQEDEHQHHHHHEPQQPIPTSQQYIYESRAKQFAQHHDSPSVSYQYIQEPIYVSQQQHYVPHHLYNSPQHSVLSTPGYLPPSPAQPAATRKVLLKQSSHEHISENNPRNTHTKVIFTDGENNDHSISYPLASITPAPRKFKPSPTQLYNHHTLHYDEETSSQHYDYQNNDSEISITQRPFNYHAHAVRQAELFKPKKRATSTTTDEQFRKLNKLIDRLKKKNE